VFSAIDSTERSVGGQTYAVRGQLDFEGGPVRVDDVYSGDVGVAAIASAGIGSPIAFAFQGGFDALKLKSVSLEVAPVERRSKQQVVDLIAARTVRPGEDLELTVVMAAQNGQETSSRIKYRVPPGTLAGTLNFTIADANPCSPILRHPPLGDVESGENLHPRYDRPRKIRAECAQRRKNTVDPDTHTETSPHGLHVNIGGSPCHCQLDNFIDRPYNRRAACKIPQLLHGIIVTVGMHAGRNRWNYM
jgi:hypothetical protein